jgi:hypothetical protein
VTQSTSYVQIVGRPLRHLTGSETPQDVVGHCHDAVTCRREDRAWARRLFAEAANLRFGKPVYKAKTMQSPVEHISIVYAVLRDDVDEQTRAMLTAERRQRVKAIL